MPVDRTLAHDLADALTILYRNVETRIAADIATRLRAGIDAPDWATQKLAAIGRLRLWVRQLLTRLDGPMAEQVAQAVILAYFRGGREALDELARLQSTHPEWLRAAELTDPGQRLLDAVAARTAVTAAQLAEIRSAFPGVEAVQRLTLSLVAKLRGAHLQIARWAEDAYREVIGRASADVLLGVATRRAASQRAWEELLNQGVTGFVDRSGRRWNLATYVEMATRSTVAQAAVEGHLDRLGAAGLDLVIVSDAPGECSACRPWEGKILTRAGTPGARTVQVPHAIRRSETVTVHIAGTVAEAVALGLMHPNCRHSLSAYLPGVTKVPTHTEDPEGDEARQRLRYLERRLRRWKLVEQTIIDPAARKRAKAKVRDYQRRIREHIAATGLIRQPSREQVNLGNITAADAGRRAVIREQKRAATAAAEAAGRERRRAETPTQRQPARETERRAAAEAAARPGNGSGDDFVERVQTRREAEIRQVEDVISRGPAVIASWEQGLADSSPSTRDYYQSSLDAARQRIENAKARLAELRASSDPSLDEPDIAGVIIRSGTPSVQRAQEHLRSVIDAPSGDREVLGGELDRQAGLAPRSAMMLRGVRAVQPSDSEVWDEAGISPTALAFYRSSGVSYEARRIYYNPAWQADRADIEDQCHLSMRSGWWTPTGAADPMASVLAHEYGHHLDACMFNPNKPLDQAQYARLIGVLGRELRIPLDPTAVTTRAKLDAWVKANQADVTDMVSTYGATNGFELLAEIWHEYSTRGDAARPHIRAIGAVIQELAEEGAFQ